MSRFVLVTRPLAECGTLQELLRPAGFEVKPFPVLRLEAVDDAKGWLTLTRRLPANADLAGVWLLFASPRAPQALAERARARGAGHLLALSAAAVGEGTADAARQAGFRVQLVGPGTGADLAASLLPRLAPGSTLVFACGHDHRPELPQALAAAGHRVVKVTVYAMRPTPAPELPALPPDLVAVVLTSPRAARYYLEGVGGTPLPCPHWALGPTTRDSAKRLGIDCRTPKRPDLESLAEDLCQI